MIVSPGIMLLMANLLHEEKYLKIMAWVMISLGVVGNHWELLIDTIACQHQRISVYVGS